MRVARLEEEQFIVSFKAHHSVYDLWSIEVLQRDLAEAYAAFHARRTPDLPRLHYQYKDYTYLDYCNKTAFSVPHRQYWLAQNESLPPELRIPGEREGPADAVGDAASLDFEIPEAVKKRLAHTALSRETSLFVVLQAAFKAYLRAWTGQDDIVIGTMLFNREGFTGLENQIGPYAKTVVIRSRLASDSLGEAIETVKKANADLVRYSAFTLLDAFVERLPQDCPASGTFWKINLYYQDARGFGLQSPPHQEPAGLAVVPYPLGAGKVPMNINLVIRFINTAEGMQVKVVYDKNKYSPPVIETLINGYLRFVEARAGE